MRLCSPPRGSVGFSPRWFIALALAGLFTLAASTSQAGKVNLWRHAARTDFEKARLDSLVIGADGSLSLGRRLREVADLKAGSVWGLVRTAQGKLLAATAEPGQIVEIAADGRLTTLWKHDKAQAFSLAALPDGSILVGTGGGEGKIYRIDPQGKASELFQVDGLYVWALAVGPDGETYAATGPKGKIFKLDREGKGSLFYESKQQHVLSLALGPKGTLLAGTDGPGLVLSITPQGAGRVLHDAGGGEIRSLWSAPDGVTYAGTASSGMSGGAAAEVPAAPRAGGTNHVYRIDAAGGVSKVLTMQGLVYCLGQLGMQSHGERVAGTGPQGILQAIDSEGISGRQLARLDAEQVLSMISDPQGDVLFGTGSPGKIFALSGEYVAQGTLTSEPLDAKLIAHFGSLNWSADAPQGTTATISVRSGNTAAPGDNWSNWSAELQDPNQAVAACPAGRFLQYRVTLATKNPKLSPEFRSLAIRYRTSNQSPQITKLIVPHVEDGDGKKTLTKLKLAWNASDPNDDELTYTLSFRKPEWKTWIKLKDSLNVLEYEWDITSVPEGLYLVRLEASDSTSNPEDEALAAARTSEPFIIDCQGPTVEAKLIQQADPRSATLEAKADDKFSPIAAASYSLDSGTWVNLFPQDRLFDAPSERFRFDLANLDPGLHVIVVRATDAAGHTSSADVVFSVEKK